MTVELLQGGGYGADVVRDEVANLSKNYRGKEEQFWLRLHARLNRPPPPPPIDRQAAAAKVTARVAAGLHGVRRRLERRFQVCVL